MIGIINPTYTHQLYWRVFHGWWF